MSTKEEIQLDYAEWAAYFINSTSQHIFLTGKAGTGKTTFLKNLSRLTHKSFVIVAPTGIAALNAGGATIHSQFLLPPGTFVPDNTPAIHFDTSNQIHTRHSLTRKHPLNGFRKQVLRSIDLLIIDEVSMLRADVLDAMDFRLKSVRRNHRDSFGGVQVLMIGDLYQLPPVVKEHEWSYLKRYYHSAHFFEALALQKESFVFIELEKIYRQTNSTFIGLLNNLRDNKVTPNDVALLNQYYKPDFRPEVEEGVITLTTHNYKADQINTKALQQLNEKAWIFPAEIEGDFPEHMYPIAERLELKIGAQVMFIRNDSSLTSRYYNGKLAKVVGLSDDGVEVQPEGSEDLIVLEKFEWENKRYTVNEQTRELDETVIGKFAQYPIKLAWAVTVHKSQGLTFDRAVIDVGSAFAPGQVYVALSRLRSLDGLILKTKIDPAVISSDPIVVDFTKRKYLQKSLDVMLKEGQQRYLHQLVNTTFDFTPILQALHSFSSGEDHQAVLDDESMKAPLLQIKNALEAEELNTTKFRQQLLHLLHTGDHEGMFDRLGKGSEYYTRLIREQAKILLTHMAEVEMRPRSKTYLRDIGDCDHLMMKALDQLSKCSSVASAIAGRTAWKTNDEWKRERESVRINMVNDVRATHASFSHQTEPSTKGKKSGKGSLKTKKEKKSKEATAKVNTVEETLSRFHRGMSIAEIAVERGLVEGTIEGHLHKAVEAGQLDMSTWISEKEFQIIREYLSLHDDQDNPQVHKGLEGKYSYGKIRAVRWKLAADQP